MPKRDMRGWFRLSFAAVSGSERSTATSFVLAQMLVAIIFSNYVTGLALAGTETGEFCCTCPDYENLEAWLAKKARLCDASGQIIDQSNKARVSSTVVEATKSYPEPQIIASGPFILDDFVIIDVRSPEEYQKGHLIGARNLYWKEFQSNDSTDPARAEKALRKAGINNTDPILIYGGGDDRASHIFWVLSYLGHENISKLNGGIDEAVKTELAVDQATPNVKASNYTICVRPWLMVNESLLDSWLSSSYIQILDARHFSDYGKARLTNASIPLDAAKFYDEGFKIKGAEVLDDLLDRRSLDRNKIQLVYGTPEAYSLFYALRLMGYNATLLEGSWWSASKWSVSSFGN